MFFEMDPGIFHGYYRIYGGLANYKYSGRL